MEASVSTVTGDKDGTELQDVNKPTPGPEDLLVNVKASAVNQTDVWIHRGHEGDPPIVTGIDTAGEVAGGGDSVDGLSAIESFSTGTRPTVANANFTTTGRRRYVGSIVAWASAAIAATANRSRSQKARRSDSRRHLLLRCHRRPVEFRHGLACNDFTSRPRIERGPHNIRGHRRCRPRGHPDRQSRRRDGLRLSLVQ